MLTAGYVGILGAGGCTAAHAELDPADGSGPAVADGRAFVSWGTRLVAFAAGGRGAPTCQPTWTANTGAEISGSTPPVATNGGQVLVVTMDGQLLSFSATNGALRWRADLDW